MRIKKINWDTSYRSSRDYHWMTTNRLSHVLSKASLPESSRILEIGCGTGQLSRDLFHRGYDVIGVDISSEAIRIAQESTIFHKKVSFKVADIEKRNMNHAEFSSIICKYVLSFINDKTSFVKYVKLLLADEGVFIIINPDIDSLPEAKKGIAMEHEEIMSLLEYEFKAVEYELIDNDYFYYARKNQTKRLRNE